MTLMTARKESKSDQDRSARVDDRVLDPAQSQDWPEFMTVGEVAQVLRMHSTTVRKRINDGHIPTVRWSGPSTVRISKRELLDYISPNSD